MKKMKKLLLTVATAFGVTTISAAAVNADTVTVKAGDTLSKIANEHNTTSDNLQKLNDLADINLIYVGEQLKINNDNNNVQQQVASTVAADNGTANSAVQQATQNTTPQVQQTATQQKTQPVVQNESYNTTTNNSASDLSSSDAAARAWIMARESGGNYNARNGQYIGAYQLSASYLNGNYSPANQDRVANQYVAQRYGSWVNAQRHWENFGWY